MDEAMNLDLNQQPSQSSELSVIEIEHEPNEWETGHEYVEERIRRLEAVSSRFRQGQGRSQGGTAPQIVNNLSEKATENFCATTENLRSVEKLGKRGGSHLVAKALGSIKKKQRSETGGYFSCNICLGRATDPVLTCCGHLFCWPCFYEWPCAYSNVKECPACWGEVTEADVIPIYGSGSDVGSCRSESRDLHLDVPPRPRAKRIESQRQEIRTPRAYFSPVYLNPAGRSARIDASGEQNQGQNTNPARITSSAIQQIPGTQRELHAQSPRPLWSIAPRESVVSSSPFALDSAMNTSLRLLDYMDAFLSNRQFRTINQEPSRGGPRVYHVSVAPVESENQSMGVVNGIRPTETLSTVSSRRRMDSLETFYANLYANGGSTGPAEGQR